MPAVVAPSRKAGRSESTAPRLPSFGLGFFFFFSSPSTSSPMILSCFMANCMFSAHSAAFLRTQGCSLHATSPCYVVEKKKHNRNAESTSKHRQRPNSEPPWPLQEYELKSDQELKGIVGTEDQGPMLRSGHHRWYGSCTEYAVHNELCRLQ